MRGRQRALPQVEKILKDVQIAEERVAFHVGHIPPSDPDFLRPPLQDVIKQLKTKWFDEQIYWMAFRETRPRNLSKCQTAKFYVRMRF